MGYTWGDRVCIYRHEESNQDIQEKWHLGPRRVPKGKHVDDLATKGMAMDMPVVRNVPVFPEGDLKPGDTWSAEGYEMHDFRASFGIDEPYRIPFMAHYTFLGNREWQGTEYPAFSVSYRIFAEPRVVSGDTYPIRIMGVSDQVVYWDRALSRAAAYQEQFRMVFTVI